MDLTPVKAAVDEQVVAISPSSTAREALRTLLGSECTRLLVRRSDDGAPEGVVTDLDFVAMLGRPR